MKAIIPVAGVGTNLRPHTFTQPKPLIPVAGKPIVAFILDQLIEAGIDEFVFVIGYLGDKIRHYVTENYPDINAEYVQQESRMGLGHAIWVTRDLLNGTSDVIIMLGDTIVDVDFDQLRNTEYSSIGTKKVADPRKFGVVEVGENGFIKKVVEKPTIPKSNLAMVGVYKIGEVHQLIDTLDDMIRHETRTHGEFQLTDAIMHMINDGAQFRQFDVQNWFDCGRKEILLETNATLLSRRPAEAIHVPETENSIIIQPVSIGENCRICNSIIGPNVSIGSNANIDSAIVQDSIIGSYATIDRVVLQHSVVGQDSAVKGMRQQLNIGDNTEIDLG